MSRKSAFFIAGIVTTIVMVLVLGVAGIANRFNQVAAAASTGNPPAAAPAAVCANPADVATLQGQLNDYQAALQQANAQLQAAYNEIAALQTQGGFSGEHEGNEHNGTFFNPFRGD
jgi:Tfp pilus assembly protein FimV